jgi:phosphoenolpyruvate---glycerone phosphotransferase subunit DhaL
MSCSNEMGIKIVEEIIRAIQQNKEYLSQVDGEIGDGDHGVNMNKGFTMASELISRQKTNMSEGFSILAKTLMNRIGGSLGPLYGTIFDEMAKASKDAPVVDVAVVRKMLCSAAEGISKISPARQGDKTMMDVLLPAVEAFDRAAAEGLDLKAALLKMKAASARGKESTRELVAKIGRSSRLGERSKGVLDAGAVSLDLILQSFADTLISFGKEENG